MSMLCLLVHDFIEDLFACLAVGGSSTVTGGGHLLNNGSHTSVGLLHGKIK